MRHDRFYFGGDLNQDFLLVDNKIIVDQIKKVLRLKVGESFILFDGQGLEATVEIKEFIKEGIRVEIKIRDEKKEGDLAVTLYLAILKKENFELAIQKAVEAGVVGIVPVITDRTIKLGLKEGRLQTIIKEASEQAGRIILSKLDKPATFLGALREAQSLNNLNIFCDLSPSEFGEEGSSIQVEKERTLGIFIGPEGGWSDDERTMAQNFGCKFCQLGQFILRAETAAIIASWLAVNKKL